MNRHHKEAPGKANRVKAAVTLKKAAACILSLLIAVTAAAASCGTPYGTAEVYAGTGATVSGVSDVTAMIRALREPYELEAADGNSIRAARQAYQNLSSSEKAQIAGSDLEKLSECETALAYREQEAVDMAKAAEVTAGTAGLNSVISNLESLIDELEGYVDDENITQERLNRAAAIKNEIAAYKTQISSVSSKYNALTYEQKAIVEDADLITEAEWDYGYVLEMAKYYGQSEDYINAIETRNAAAAEPVSALVAEMFDPYELAGNEVFLGYAEEKISAARNAYEALTPEQKQYVEDAFEITYKEQALGDVRDYAAQEQAGVLTYAIYEADHPDIPNQTYTGSLIKPEPVLKHRGKTLTEGVDYELSYRLNKAIGTGVVVITGKGRYEDSFEMPFSIVPETPQMTKIYNVASGIELKWNAAKGASGYYVYRKKSSETKWTRVGTTKSGTLIFTDKKAPTPYKYQYCVRAINGSYQSKLSSPMVMYKIDAPTVTRMTNSPTCRLTVAYTTNKYYSGYQVTCSTDNKYKTNVKTITTSNPNTNNRTFTGLKKGKTYYFRVRSYRTVNDVKYYSNWGPTKAIKITK
jgi:hypothetical protein